MNILPKKRWHVRTKENVARVLRDEENARLEAEKEQGRILKAESESRLALLREKASVKYQSTGATSFASHINLFSSSDSKLQNDAANEEKAEEQKKWEIKVGYLKQLGQGSSELAEEKPWYQKPPESKEGNKRKQRYDPTDLLDPLNEMRKRRKNVDYATPVPAEPETVFVDIDFHDKVIKYSDEHRKYGKVISNIPSKGKEKKKKKLKRKHKKHKKKKKHQSSSSSSESDIDDNRKSLKDLREERLKREEAEKIRAQKLLNPSGPSRKTIDDVNLVKPRMQQKYNSQFNPMNVRSNYR